MIYYFLELTNNILISINNLIIFSYKKIYNTASNYLISFSKNKILIKNSDNKLKITKSISFNLIPKKNISNNDNNIDKIIFEEIILNKKYKFDYKVKYLSNDKLYGWYVDIEEKQHFIK